jgi:hypothetical protein
MISVIETVNINDTIRENMHDKFVHDVRKTVKGRVEIFTTQDGEELERKEYDGTNLVIYRGRSWLAQRAFGIDKDASLYSDKFISWFAFGNGGCVNGQPYVPSSPNLNNTGLVKHGVIGPIGMRHITVGGKQYAQFDAGSPDFIDDTEVPAGSVADSMDRLLVAKINVTFDKNQANNDDGISDASAFQEINEAGLFFADKNKIDDAPTQLDLFARVTFPTIFKNRNKGIRFSWYLYF